MLYFNVVTGDKNKFNTIVFKGSGNEHSNDDLYLNIISNLALAHMLLYNISLLNRNN